MKEPKVSHYSVIRLPGNGFSRTHQFCQFDGSLKKDFDKWCDENLDRLYSSYGRDMILCRKHYTDGEMTYFNKQEKSK